MSTSDPAATYAALRDETAEMLKLDAANLSLVEGLQLDLVSLLRLEVDGLQGQVLAGAAVDLSRLSTALAMLQKLLPTQLVAPPAAADRDPFAGAREELSQLLAGRADAIERNMARDPAAARAAFETKLQLAVAKHSKTDVSEPAAGGDAQSASVPHPLPSEAPAGGGGVPLLVEPPPQPAPRPQRVESDIERMNRVNSTPALPPAREPEPWRKFVDADGNIISPWFIPHG